jgi:hypothetical protein
MLKLFTLRTLPMVAVATVTLLLAAPALAETVYSWRTEDGGYAFTDDADNIPPRYRDQASASEAGKLGDYARFTAKDPSATARYEERLADRLQHLRALNARPAAVWAAERAGRETPPPIWLRTGGENSPNLEITPGEGQEPIVVETIHTRPAGKVVTRQSVVVRQGDRTLAIVKPRSRDVNIARDILWEEELER